MTARTPLSSVIFVALVGALLCLAPGAVLAEDAEREVDEKAQAAELIAGFKDKSPTVKVQALEKAVSNQHASLLSPMIRLLSDRELGVRLGAIEALAARTDKAAKKKAASSLGSRLKRLSQGKADSEELLLVIESLGTLRQPSAVKPLLDPIKDDTEVEEMKARVKAVGNIPHASAVESLIDFLAKGRRHRRGQRGEAHKALRYLTGANVQEHRTAGKDADRWRAWWKDNKKHIDLEAIAEARDEAAAEKAAQAEAKRKKKEERRRKKRENAEKRKKEREKKQPKPPPTID